MKKLPLVFNKILIVRTDRIGDVVLTTPAIKSIRQSFPSSHIAILVSPSTVELVNGNPYLNEVMVDDRAGNHKGLFGFIRLIREIRLKQFDLVLVFHTKRRFNLACTFAGIPFRLGYRNNKFGFLLTHPLKDVRIKGEKHEAEYCLDLLKVIGVANEDLDLFVPFQKDSEAWALGWLQENNLKTNEFITIHPGASDLAKCWPIANFALLIDRLIERYKMKIVLIGSSQTLPVSVEIMRKVGQSSQILSLTSKTSVSQLASLLRRSRLLISNDSGPVHVAAGVGINVISIFMRKDPGINSERWKPLGYKGFILDNKIQPGAISVDSVLELADQVIQRNKQYEIF